MKWAGEEDFFAAMDANPDAVYAVELYSGTERRQLGLFSTKAKAAAWCDRPEFDEMTAVVCPFVIDEPDFGNAGQN
jgi:hypothetical protein